jgi:glycosyltransferase involved in cell wall biosynthesis
MLLRPSAAPSVSVVCCFLDAEDFLAEAIDSVLAQDFGQWELLLVDDGSRDGGATIARRYVRRDPARIKLLAHPGGGNRGASPSRNLALAQARGEFVAFIDADDVWRPHKLADQIALLASHPEAGMVCGRVTYWWSWAGGSDRLVPTGVPGQVLAPPETLLRLYPLGHAAAPCPSDILLRTSVAKAVGGFEERFGGPLQIYEDQGFFAKIYLATPVLFSTRTWLDYRQHDASCTAVSHRRGEYAAMRREFLAWLAAYAADLPARQRQAVASAVERAEWQLDHPLTARIGRRLRTMVTA